MNWLRKIFALSLVQVCIILGLVACTGAILFAPNIYWARVISHYALYVMLLQLAAGFFFLTMKSKRLMFASFICCGILCLFLKNASNENIVLPEKNKEILSVKMGLFNVSRFTDDLDQDMNIIRALDADIIFFHEVTPEWETFLMGELSECYDHQYFHIRIDPFGQAIFSKIPFTQLDTAYYQDTTIFTDIPALGASFVMENLDTIRCASIHSLPPTGKEGYANLGNQLSQVGSQLMVDQYSNFVFAYLNVPAWNSEVQNFRYVYDLKDSRRVSKLFKMPYEHLLYSGDMECIEFIEQQSSNQYIGLIGTYQKTIELEASVD